MNKFYNIRKGSFLESFPNTKLFVVLEGIKCFLCKELNIEKGKKVLDNTIKENISKITIDKYILKYKICKTIKRFYDIVYDS